MTEKKMRLDRDGVVKRVNEARDSGKLPNLQGVDLSNVDLRHVDLEGVILRGANLNYADLYSANLRDTRLEGANLQNAYLGLANLRYADLDEANLRYANLDGANLQGVVLYGADLQGADLKGANLRYTDLNGTNLRDADLYGANLGSSNWRGLQVTTLPSGQLTLTPTCDGWKLRVGCWKGTPDQLRDLISQDEDWPYAEGEEILRRRPYLQAALALCEVHMKDHQDVIEELKARWGNDD